jgi:putative hydrolase of the HAD superfamily
MKQENPTFAKTIMMKDYQHIFFDLDRTLWDFDKNAHETFCDIFEKYDLENRGAIKLDDFVVSYINHNERLWALYRDGNIEKHYLRWHRFEATLRDFQIDDQELAKTIGNAYVTISPQKTNLLPNAVAVLGYLKEKYALHIITNGFEEVQFTKMKNCNIRHFFDHIITSEAAGSKKPDAGIFDFALNVVGTEPSKCIMIGDDLDTDIIGAAKAGIDAIYFNPGNVPHNGGVLYEISDLNQLTQML